MKNNEKLQHEVYEAIRQERLLIGAEINVTVQDGIVTLTGTVDSYAEKLATEHVVKTVPGVLSVVDKIEVKFGKHGKEMIWKSPWMLYFQHSLVSHHYFP